jgi:hypothetical protein
VDVSYDWFRRGPTDISEDIELYGITEGNPNAPISVLVRVNEVTEIQTTPPELIQELKAEFEDMINVVYFVSDTADCECADGGVSGLFHNQSKELVSVLVHEKDLYRELIMALMASSHEG